MNIRHALIAPETALFRVLHGIADSVNILLIVCLLAVLIIGTKQKTLTARAWLAAFSTVALVYIAKTIDGRLGIWKSLAWDYSTHSALAAVLVISLCFFLFARTQRIVVLSVFVVYEVLIVVLGFHSIADILSTLLLIIPLSLALHWLLAPKKPSEIAVS